MTLGMDGNARVEKDALGEVAVPADPLWGAQAERSRRNFPIGVERHRWVRPEAMTRCAPGKGEHVPAFLVTTAR